MRNGERLSVMDLFEHGETAFEQCASCVVQVLRIAIVVTAVLLLFTVLKNSALEHFVFFVHCGFGFFYTMWLFSSSFSCARLFLLRSNATQGLFTLCSLLLFMVGLRFRAQITLFKLAAFHSCVLAIQIVFWFLQLYYATRAHLFDAKNSLNGLIANTIRRIESPAADVRVLFELWPELASFFDDCEFELLPLSTARGLTFVVIPSNRDTVEVVVDNDRIDAFVDALAPVMEIGPAAESLQRRDSNESNDDSRLDNSDISDSARKSFESNVLCAICLGRAQEDFKSLPCQHVFHTPCLKSWFRRQLSCPICRRAYQL